jgi:drug/metabolite transporter (DMT)-like permease
MSPAVRATLIGFSAILMWSLLAVLTVATGRVPPFQLAAITFAIGGALGVASRLARGGGLGVLRQRAEVWTLGVSGLFGYHALYFMALRLAPPAEAGLLNYLWPLLIVLFSALLPGERLRLHHVAGALLGLFGTVVLFSGSSRPSCGRAIPSSRAASPRCRPTWLRASASPLPCSRRPAIGCSSKRYGRKISDSGSP